MLLPLCVPRWNSITSSFGVLHRQLPQQDLVDQREDGGVGADAQRQRQDRDGRKQRAAAQAADGKAEIGS